MQKVPTMFVRDETKPGHPVIDEWKPECLWVSNGEGVATVKLDGTNVKVENGQLFKRQKPKERDYDEASYVPCDRSNPADKWAFEGYDRGQAPRLDGIYELLGPKIQGNPLKYPSHMIVRVVPPDPAIVILDRHAYPAPRDFHGLKAFFESDAGANMEGLVFHHPDGRMAKIKQRDFGLRPRY